MNTETATSSSDTPTDDIQEKRIRFIESIYQEYPKLIFAATERSMFGSSAEDMAFEPCDHLQELLLHLITNPAKLDAMMREGTAKTSTRLFALAQSRMRGHRTKINRRRCLAAEHRAEMTDRRFALADVPDQFLPTPRFGGCEFASTREEVSATKAAYYPEQNQIAA